MRTLEFTQSIHIVRVAGPIEVGATSPKSFYQAGQVFSSDIWIEAGPNSSLELRIDGNGPVVRISSGQKLFFARRPSAKIPSAPLSVHSSPTPGKVAVVRAVRGVAEFRADDGQWRPLRVNMSLPTGTRIRTGDGGAVDLVVKPSGLVARLNPGTTVAVSGMNSLFPPGSLLVESGSAVSNSKQLAKGN